MTKTACFRLTALVLAMLMMIGTAFAQETNALANHPECGLVLPMTQADADMGLYTNAVTDEYGLAMLNVIYIHLPVVTELEIQLQEAAAAQDEEKITALMEQAYQHNYLVAQVLLLPQAVYDSLTAQGNTVVDLMGYETAKVCGTNDGHVYIAVTLKEEDAVAEDAQEQEMLRKAVARGAELIDGMTFQPIVVSRSDGTTVPNAFPAFSTVDLNGNTVTQDIFAGKDLTVVNIWGTFCTPCINEMPEMGEWAKTMPENVQLIGLVSDLPSADDADTLEMAQLICEKSGVEYINLIANSDFAELLSGVVGVPTTIFVDGNGAIVGEPIVGAYVDGYKQFVEEYLNALP